MTVKKIFNINKKSQSFSTPARQSMEAFEDYSVKKNLNTLEGTIEKTPVDDSDIANKKYVDDNSGGAPEGTAVLSTGEVGGVKFLREDGDGTCSWQAAAGGGDVTSGAAITDNSMVRGDGGAKGVQESLAIINDDGNLSITNSFDGLLGTNITNTFAGATTVAGAVNQVTNDQGYWGLVGMTSSASTIGASAFINTMHNYNQGYGDTLFTVDGNVDFAWYSDPTDQHDFTALSNEIMRLDATGNLTLTGTVDGIDIATDVAANTTHRGIVTGNPHVVLLDEVGNPGGNVTFTMANKSIVYNYVAPVSTDGAFEINIAGAFSGDALHVHQHTGNPGVTNLIHCESTDTDVTPLRLDGAGTYDMIAGDISVGDIVTSGTVDGIDIATDVAANTTFRGTPSTVITAGTNLTWAGNTLNATVGGSVEGTAVLSTGVSAGSVLTADGDNTSSWQPPAGGGGGASYFIGGTSNANVVPGTTTYIRVVGMGHNTNENYNEAIACGSITVSSMSTNVVVNSMDASTVVTMRKNSADGNQTVTYGAATTGNATDATGSDSYIQYDQFSTKADATASSSGTLTYLRTAYKVE